MSERIYRRFQKVSDAQIQIRLIHANGANFRRNFTDELSGQKVVRLVFNGHVLQPDTKTLKACGLFDNCVVHCLVHNPRPYSNLTTNPGNNLGEQGMDDFHFHFQVAFVHTNRGQKVP